MSFRQRRSRPVSDKDDYGETGLPQIEISQAPLPESLQKPGPVIQRSVSSEGSNDSSLDLEQDADHGHKETPYSAADDHTILDIVTYSLHITFEGEKVPSKYKNVTIHLSNLSNYEDIAAEAEGCVKEQLENKTLADKSVNFRHGECAIKCKKNDKPVGDEHTHGLSNHADWTHLCTVLTELWTSTGSPDIHLEIHREYFGLLIPRVSEGGFAKAKRNEIYYLMKTAFDGRKYLPQSDLSKVVSKDMVREIIAEDPSVPSMERESFIEMVWHRAPKLLTMCVLAPVQMSCLKLLLEKGRDDDTNPLKEEHRCHRECAQDFKALLDWYRGLNAATFLRPGDHHRFAKEIVLPIHYHPKPDDQTTSRAPGTGDTSEKEIESDEEESENSDKHKALCGSGAFSKVYRVRLDPAHHSLTKVSEFIASLQFCQELPIYQDNWGLGYLFAMLKTLSI